MERGEAAGAEGPEALHGRMRYYLRGGTLFARGDFRAVSTGAGGGLGTVSTLLLHTVPPGREGDDPLREISRVVSGEGLPGDVFGLLTPFRPDHLCILQHDYLVLFISAGIREDGSGTINVIVSSREGMSDAALAGAIITVTEAKTRILLGSARSQAGMPTDAVIVASEGPVTHHAAGALTPAGKRIDAAIQFGLPQALRGGETPTPGEGPRHFIFSRFGGDHWVEWRPGSCPYYPCHFEGQRCEFCYCPFYPCRDESLGQWVESSSGNGPVWNCAGCTLLHQPAIADYLVKNPEARLRELKAREGGKK